MQSQTEDQDKEFMERKEHDESRAPLARMGAQMSASMATKAACEEPHVASEGSDTADVDRAASESEPSKAAEKNAHADGGDKTRSHETKVEHLHDSTHRANVKLSPGEMEERDVFPASEIAEEGVTPRGPASRSSSGRLMSKSLSSLSSSSSSSSRSTLANAHPEFKPQGRQMMNMRVKQERQLLCWVRDAYTWMLKLPASRFLLCIFSAPLLLATIFTPLFLLNLSGLEFNDDAIFEPPELPDVFKFVTPLWDEMFLTLHVFIFVLSLCTTFGGSPVEVRSPYAIFVANLVVLTSQLLFVFLSSAVFSRFARPPDFIRAAKRIIISDTNVVPQPEGEKFVGQGYSVLWTRFAITGPRVIELVDVKLTMTFRIHILTSTGSFFMSNHELPLVRSEIPHLKYGFNVRHVIDESSPLFGRSYDDLLGGDSTFSLCIVATERSSMQQIFFSQEYFVYGGDLVLDCMYEDIFTTDGQGSLFADHNRISNIVRATNCTKL